MFLAADFINSEAAAQAIVSLKTDGFKSDALAVFSDEPIEFHRNVLHRSSRMSLAAVTGAISFGLLAIGFVHFTQYDYPLVTGGMPIFSFWSTGVVFYELTMLGAIVTTFVWFLAESGLLSRGRSQPVPRIVPGIVCLRIVCATSQAEKVRSSLLSAGAENIRVLGEET